MRFPANDASMTSSGIFQQATFDGILIGENGDEPWDF